MDGAKTVGIVGGGQLGRMLTLAAKPLGFYVVVVDPNRNSPAAQVGAQEITADFRDQAAIRQLAEHADYLTIESEHVGVDTLEELSAIGKPVNPSPATVRMIQDKLKQKQFLSELQIATAPFAEVTDELSAQKLLKQFGGKMLVKTRHNAFDGRGNMVVTDKKSLRNALQKFAGQSLYAEQFVPFVKELAVIIARSLDGDLLLYPVVETIHKRNICVEVIAPAPVNPRAIQRAESLARQVAEHLKGAGVFGIELFLTADDRVLVNEIAPRVHNSGHFTLDACHTSQFEQHIRAITGLPLGDPALLTPAAVMINVLGEQNAPVQIRGLDRALSVPHTAVHLYGKSPTKIDRKMGHITATAATIEQARSRARRARKHLSV